MKATKKQFEMYQKECRKWIEVFGLKDWEIFFSLEGDISPAGLIFSRIDRVATFTFSPEQSLLDLKTNQIKKNAFHEVCELLLGKLRTMVEQRYGLLEEEINEEIHVVIERMQRLIE